MDIPNNVILFRYRNTVNQTILANQQENFHDNTCIFTKDSKQNNNNVLVGVATVNS